MRKHFLIISILLTLLAPRLAVAEGFASDKCMDDIENALSREQRIYRTILFGFTHASEAPLGETRYDNTGRGWIKMEKNVWVSYVEQGSDLKRTDKEMDAQAEGDPHAPSPFRRGIFAMSGALTSELIPDLTQSARALKCRTAAVCEVASLTFKESGLDLFRTFTVQPPGCMEFKDQQPLFACQLGAEKDVDGSFAHTADESFVMGYCEQISAQLLDREFAMLKLAVSYDAAYRSLLQFAGHFDLFTKTFRASILTPIRQAVSLLGSLHRIPCFLAQCDQ